MAFQIPLLLALALTGGGIAANKIGADKAADAQAATMAAERRRQKKLDAEAFGINTKGRKRYEGFEQKQAAEGDELASYLLEGADEEADKGFGLPASESAITVSRGKEEKAKARADTDQRARSRAKLESFGDVLGDIGLSQARDAGDLGMVYGFKRGSQGVLPLELDAAAQEGAGWRLAGDILGGAGSLATMGHLSGATLPGLGGVFARNTPLAGTNMLAARRPPAGLLSLFGRG